MNIYSQFETDESIEKDGIVLSYGPNSQKQIMGIRIARAGGANVAFNKRMQVLFKPHQRALSSNTMDPDLLRELVQRAYAETVVKDLENFEDRDGNPIPYSKENVVKLFKDLPALWADVQRAADDWTLFKKDLLEEAAKN